MGFFSFVLGVILFLIGGCFCLGFVFVVHLFVFSLLFPLEFSSTKTFRHISRESLHHFCKKIVRAVGILDMTFSVKRLASRLTGR